MRCGWLSSGLFFISRVPSLFRVIRIHASAPPPPYTHTARRILLEFPGSCWTGRSLASRKCLPARQARFRDHALDAPCSVIRMFSLRL